MIKRMLVLAVLLTATVATAQDPPVATGLIAPMEIAFSNAGNLIVSEAGNGPNTGRISLIDRALGERRTLVEGLPSGIAVLADGPSPSGPGGLALANGTLYVTIGNGDAVRAGPLPGTEVESTPSSPILSSVLSLRANPSLDVTRGGFVLQPSQHAALKSGQVVTLTNGAGETLEIRLVVDFPNFVAEPRPDFAQNVRLSNPFGVAVAGQHLYVVDASHNLVRRVEIATGAHTVFATFPGLPNNSGMGPPVIDAVPNNIRLRGNELLVGTLTGFPFPAGQAEVRRMSLANGSHERLAGGLTTVIDVATLGESAASPILVLEFSANMLGAAPGRLRLVWPNTEPVTVADGLITPTGMAVDRRSGEVFITHLGPGIVTRVRAGQQLPLLAASDILPVAGSAVGAFNSRFRTALQLSNPGDFPISGRIVFHPQGRSARPDDPSLPYTLRPFETRSYADVVQSAGASGVGTIDVVPAVGPAPTVVARIIDDASSRGTTAQVPMLDASHQLHAGMRAAILTPEDPAATRLNIGIRSLDAGVRMEVTVYGSDGSRLRTATVSYPGQYFIQVPASTLTGGAIGGNQLIVFRVLEGSAIVYGAATNNDGSGLTLQIAEPAP